MSNVWKRCSSCKAEIPFGATYYLCSVSTCNRKRTGLTFCSVDCWDQHLPIARHRDAVAEEERAPTRAQWEAEQAGGAEPRRVLVPPPKPSVPAQPQARRRIIGEGPPPGPREILIIASRLKDYVREVHGMNTSDRVFEILSDEVRRIANRAAKNAADAERKTLLDRDFDFLKRG
jgi:alkylhydroperoxidase family enzyme